jgi:hypothetical protein
MESTRKLIADIDPTVAEAGSDFLTRMGHAAKTGTEARIRHQFEQVLVARREMQSAKTDAEGKKASCDRLWAELKEMLRAGDEPVGSQS